MAHTHHHHSRIKWDKIGVSLSIACSIHCLLMPFVIAFLPAIGQQYLDNVWMEATLLGSSFVLAGVTFVLDYKRLHANRLPLLILVAALLIALMQRVFFTQAEIILAPLTGITVFGAYVLNWYMRRQYAACTHD